MLLLLFLLPLFQTNRASLCSSCCSPCNTLSLPPILSAERTKRVSLRDFVFVSSSLGTKAIALSFAIADQRQQRPQFEFFCAPTNSLVVVVVVVLLFSFSISTSSSVLLLSSSTFRLVDAFGANASPRACFRSRFSIDDGVVAALLPLLLLLLL